MPGSPNKSRLLLYGAYGYTGRLTAELAAARKVDVVLAGRNQDALLPLGDRLSLPTRVVGLNDPEQLSAALKDVACVVHMAGPFAVTSAPMLSACLTTKTNYIDITGEIEVFEALWSREEEIRRAGITVLPGAGFDVVPSDCLAGYVASKLERPCSLVIALRGLESASQGTLRTAIRQVSKPVLCRHAGTIVPLEERSPLWIDFGSGDEPFVPVSWGDIATAFHSTGVGDITAYFRSTKLLRSADIVGRLFGPLFRSRFGQRGLEVLVHRFPEGPSQAERNRRRSTIWAEATEPLGRSFKAILSTPDAYDFTANSTLEISSRIISLPVPLGLVTPFQAFGADFVLSLPGCARTDIPSSQTDPDSRNDVPSRESRGRSALHLTMGGCLAIVGQPSRQLIRRRKGGAEEEYHVRVLLEVLEQAQKNGVAVDHFNISDLVLLKSVFAAARELNVPVVVGASHGEREFMGVRQIAALVHSLQEEFDFPIFLNADHTHSLSEAVEAVKAGFDAVVFDASALPSKPNRQSKSSNRSMLPSSLKERLATSAPVLKYTKRLPTYRKA